MIPNGYVDNAVLEAYAPGSRARTLRAKLPAAGYVDTPLFSTGISQRDMNRMNVL
jgi:hypothetical protein